jgi:phage terminase small subunit
VSRPKDAETLKLHGTFRKDRHAGRENIPPPQGEPVRPASLKGDALKHWKENLPRLMSNRTIGESDTTAFVLLCETYALQQQALRVVRRNAVDKDARIAFLEYSRQWIALATQLGLTSYAKMKLLASNPPEKSTKTDRSSFARNRDAM